MLQEDGVSIAPSSSFLSLSLSPSLTHASAVWLMAGDQSKSAWETEYFSGKIILLDLLCNTKAVLCFTLTLHWGRGACCASGSSFLCAWIKNMSEYAFSLLPPHTHTHRYAHTHTSFPIAQLLLPPLTITCMRWTLLWLLIDSEQCAILSSFSLWYNWRKQFNNWLKWRAESH